MEPTDFDLLVIGGGPCGSTAAAFARQRGLSVCVAERDTFPRFHIGESLLPAGNAVLRASGAWPKIEAAGFIKKWGASFCLADGSAEKRIDFSKGIVPGLEQTYQVERATFDAILLDHAKSLGADVRMQTRVAALEADSDAVTVTLAPKNRPEEKVTARWVIDAGGRENLYANENKRPIDPPRFPRRTAIYNHFFRVPRPTGPEGGDTIVVRLDDGWFWIIPIDEERTSVGLVTTTESIRRAGGEPEAVFDRTVAASPRLRELLEGATAAGEFRVTSDYSYFRRALAFERVILAGDAGGFFDPIFSSGVCVATWSAQLAVQMIARAHAAKRTLTRAERARYTRRVKAHAGVFGRLIAAFYDNDSFTIFLSPHPPMDLERGINSIVAGHAKLTWPLWWRFTVFLTVCWLQKRFHFAPALGALGRENASAPAGSGSS